MHTRNPRSLITALAAVALIALSAVAGQGDATSASSAVTTRVSVASNGAEANGDSFANAISSDGGFVAFQSGGSNLVAGDTNGRADIFVHDRQTGATERATVNGAGGGSGPPSVAISADGRFVAYDSLYTDIVPGDTNNASDVFVHDRQTGITERVSVDSSENQGNGLSAWPAISADGRYVAFYSVAALALVSGFPNIYLRDRLNGTTELVASGGNGIPAISGDGRFVAFDLPSSGVSVRDRQLGTTETASVDMAGFPAPAADPAINDDGRFVAFRSSAGNLVPGDTNNENDIFVRDRLLDTTERVSVDSAGYQGTGFPGSWDPSMTSDGRFIAFYSYFPDLVEGGYPDGADVFVHDLETGITTRVSLGSAGGEANDWSGSPSVSGDGRLVAFLSFASNLVAGDTNGFIDIFVHDQGDMDGDGEWDGVDTDDDNDTWSDLAEATIGTDPLAACGAGAWPADIDSDGFSDIFDIAFLANYFGASVPPAPARYNIDPNPPDGFVDILDIARMANFFGRSCA